MVEEPLLRAFRLRAVGRTEEVRARVYAVSPERRIKHPAVAAICDTARSGLGVKRPAASAARP